MQAPTEDKSDDKKGNFYEELEWVIHKFPKDHRKILSDDFNVKVGTQDIFRQTIQNESLHEHSNENGVTEVNFATLKRLSCQHYNVPSSYKIVKQCFVVST